MMFDARLPDLFVAAASLSVDVDGLEARGN
jgi:hypothetical protein